MAINEYAHLNDVKLSVMNFLLMYIANVKFVLLNRRNFLLRISFYYYKKYFTHITLLFHNCELVFV